MEARMRFSKQELYKELEWFMPTFAHSVERMYGAGASVLMRSPGGLQQRPDIDALQQTPLWSTLGVMYDYGFLGIDSPECTMGEGPFADVELFMTGLDDLDEYLREDDGGVPRLCQQTVAMAVARHVLDGGDRYRLYEDADHLLGRLTFAELALLADMDERSVRNAANPKLPDPLKSVVLGKRSLIPIEEAQRWLSGRKGFVPTGANQPPEKPFLFAKTVDVPLPTDLVRQLHFAADDAGMKPEDLIRTLLGDRGAAEAEAARVGLERVERAVLAQRNAKP
jgi:hypothetical protein